MNSLNIDFRDSCLRVLKVESGKFAGTSLVSDFSLTDRASAIKTLSAEIDKLGKRNARVNIILTQEMIQQTIQQIPRTDTDSLSMILRRKISKDLSGSEFSFGFKEIAEHRKARTGTSSILSEYVENRDLSEYIALLKECGIKPGLITSGLEGNLQLFNKLRPETQGNEAVIDIGAGHIEIIIISNGRLIDYEKLPLLIDFSNNPDETNTAEDQASKIKIYKIVDVLYNSINTYIKEDDQGGLSRIWICGIGSTLENISESISSSFGMSTDLLIDSDMQTDGSAFSAISGVSHISTEEGITNFIPATMLKARQNLIKQVVMASLLAVYIAVLIGTYKVTITTEKDLRYFLSNNKPSITAAEALPGDQNIYSTGQGTMVKIVSGSPALYGIFSDIANLIPSEVQLQKIEFMKNGNTTTLSLEAKIKHKDESYQKAIMTRYLNSIESSARLKNISIPTIVTSGDSSADSFITVKSGYEVVK